MKFKVSEKFKKVLDDAKFKSEYPEMKMGAHVLCADGKPKNLAQKMRNDYARSMVTYTQLYILYGGPCDGQRITVKTYWNGTRYAPCVTSFRAIAEKDRPALTADFTNYLNVAVSFEMHTYKAILFKNDHGNTWFEYHYEA